MKSSKVKENIDRLLDHYKDKTFDMKVQKDVDEMNLYKQLKKVREQLK